jgi:hypothetical protein
MHVWSARYTFNEHWNTDLMANLTVEMLDIRAFIAVVLRTTLLYWTFSVNPPSSRILQSVTMPSARSRQESSSGQVQILRENLLGFGTWAWSDRRHSRRVRFSSFDRRMNALDGDVQKNFPSPADEMRNKPGIFRKRTAYL